MALTEGRWAAEFIMSEANGNRSRENGTVASGQTLVAGQLVQLSGPNLVAWAGTGTATVGIMINNVDATDGAVDAAYIARDAEVNFNLLTFPTGSDDDDDEGVASLLLLGIIARS